MASLEEQLSKIALKQVKINGKTLAEIMVSEAQRLADCIQFYIDKYYESYKPVIYRRTGRYKKSLCVDDIAHIRVVGNTIHISVGFNELAMHNNLSGVYQDYYGTEYWLPIRNRHKTFVPILMEEGWHSEKLASMLGRKIYRLTDFDGIHAVRDGIDDFNKTNKYGIKIYADDFYNAKAY